MQRAFNTAVAVIAAGAFVFHPRVACAAGRCTKDAKKCARDSTGSHEGTRKRMRARMPDHLCSTLHVEIELRSGMSRAHTMRGAASHQPVLKQRITQELTLQTAGGSTFAARTANSLKLGGDTPLHDAAERYPEDALRVFMRKHHRTYTDESPEFPERLRIFKENAKGIREVNALLKKRKGDGAKVRFLPTVALLECWAQIVEQCLPAASITAHFRVMV
ncbi:hypothetical protein CVIRNUC_003851 [Coccomyxa viridis]|uniref:Uncharacterized protein n=1 Tax=Coccomyxa viridis TaxID=1274662 RepID=A0AAV1HZU5_9CHLO|nr:hypothetical protein CVIRNUC_003851 [Coccomyxa viridis]